jgi:hypothetical protein
VIAFLLLAIAAEARCPIHFDGERDAVERLREVWLRMSAFPVREDTACRTRRVWVSSQDDEWSIELVDESGRGARRRVRGVEVAALLVESWTHAELLSLVPALRPAARVPIVPEHAPIKNSVAVAVADRRSEHAVELSAELGHDGDAFWLGAAAAMRARWEELEPRVMLRAAHAREDGAQPAARIGVALLAGVDLPIELGALVFSPGIAAGAGWMHNTRRRIDRCGDFCPSLVEDGFAASTFTLHIEPRLATRISIHATWALELALSADLAPFAHRQAFLPDYVEREAALASKERELLSIPGEPLVVVRIGAGVRWEGL